MGVVHEQMQAHNIEVQLQGILQCIICKLHQRLQTAHEAIKYTVKLELIAVCACLLIYNCHARLCESRNKA